MLFMIPHDVSLLNSDCFDVSVRIGESAPVLMYRPTAATQCGYSLLGLGDVVIPGECMLVCAPSALHIQAALIK